MAQPAEPTKKKPPATRGTAAAATDHLRSGQHVRSPAAAKSAPAADGTGVHPQIPVASWLAALADSLDRDPATTPIGEFTDAA